LAPRFGIGARELSIVDGASLGLFAALILAIGAWMAIRNRSRIPAWARYSSIAAAFGFIVAVSQVVPGTLGRSFLGFVILALPLCMAGLVLLSRKTLIFGASLCSLVAMAAIIVSPSHPLLPIKALVSNNPKLSTYLNPYFAFQDRTISGVSLVQKVPEKCREIGILANSDQNLIHLWGNRSARNRVSFYPAKVTLNELYQSKPDCIILAGSTEGTYLELREQLLADPRFEIIAEENYQTKNTRGPELWSLIQKRHAKH
jgi:hypothetical protein